MFELNFDRDFMLYCVGVGFGGKEVEVEVGQEGPFSGDNSWRAWP